VHITGKYVYGNPQFLANNHVTAYSSLFSTNAIRKAPLSGLRRSTPIGPGQSSCGSQSTNCSVVNVPKPAHLSTSRRSMTSSWRRSARCGLLRAVRPRRRSQQYVTACHSHTSPPSASTTSFVQLVNYWTRVRLLTYYRPRPICSSK